MRTRFPALLILLAGLILTLGAQAQTPDKAAAANDNYAQQITALTSRYEAFRIYSEDNPQFAGAWLKMVRESAADQKATAQVPTYVLGAGAEILLDAINPYLLRSDDASASGYLKIMAKLIRLGSEDEVVCKAFLQSDSKKGLSDTENAHLESTVGPKIYEDMMSAFGSVYRTGRTGLPKNPTPEQYDTYMQILIDGMFEQHGEESMKALANIDSPDMPAMKKCQSMTLLLNAMAAMPVNQQAVIVRKMFASED